MERMKSVLYARVSTMDELSTNSYLQQQLYKDDKFDIERIYSDRASGSSVDKRESFLEMLSYCGIRKEGNNYFIENKTDIECIIVANVSRFSRSIVDARLIIDALHKNNVKVYFIDLNKYSTDSDIFLTLNMYLVVEEEYLRCVSSKVKSGMQRKIATGYVLGSNKIWGYTYEKREDGNGYLVPHPTESLMVKAIFKDYLSGMATRALGKKYKLSPTTILQMLKNVKYKGYMGYNLKSDNPIYVKSPFITPIISEEAFEEVQRIRLGRCNSDNGKGRRIEVRNLTGKVKCVCGYNMHYKRSNKELCCGNTTVEGRTKGCGANQFNTKTIIPWLENNIDNLEKNLEFRLNNEIREVNVDNLSNLEIRKEELKRKESKLMDLFLDGELPKDMLKRKQSEIAQELQDLEEKISILNDMHSHLNQLRRLKITYKNDMKNIRKLIKENNLEEIEKLISKIELVNRTDLITFREKTEIKSIRFSCFDEAYNTNFVIDEAYDI